MKKIIVIGVGAQGSTIAKRMDEHPGISEIVCADYDSRAAQALSNSLRKAKALTLDARDINNVISAAEGCDLIVNGLPLEFNLTIMEAALAAKASYMDMAGSPCRMRFEPGACQCHRKRIRGQDGHL